MEIKLESTGKYSVKFSYRPALVTMIKNIPGRTFNPASKAWMIPESSKPQLESMAKRIVHFEPVEWVNTIVSDQRPEKLLEIPEMPQLTIDHGLKVQPYPYQLQGIARGLELKRFMNTDEPGLGKAQILNSLISTPKGWIRMGDIKVGDSIFAKDGSIQKVEGVFPQGVVPTYRMTFNDGSFVDCNLEHLWSVRDQNRRRRGFGWTTKTTEEILKSGLVNKSNPKREASGRKPSLKWEIPMCGPVMYPTKQFIIPAYTMGALIGDGSLSHGTLKLSLPKEKNGVIEIISSELDSCLEITTAKYEEVFHYSLVKSINKTNHNIENLYTGEIRRLKLDVVSGEKFIPTEYLQGDVDQRMELLAGLMDTDGSCIKNRTTFHTTSKQLTIDIKELVESLGGIAIIRPYDRTEEDKGIEYQVNINTSFNPFFLKYKNDLWTPNKMFKPTRYIESIEYVGEEEQQCILVSSPDHLYLTNNFIVTHNTLQAIATINLADAFPCLVVCPSSLKINWEREWHKFSDKKAMVLSDKVRDTWPFFWNTGLYQVFIVNYESLKKYFVQSIKPGKKLTLRDVTFRENVKLFKSVIIDESHRCKSSATQQAKFVKGITAGKEWIIELTGTPVVNRPKDLLSQLSILGKLEEFGGYKYFINRYCSGPNEASNLKELNSLLWQKSMFRREKSTVLKDLPDKIRSVMTCEITNRKEYKDAERDLIQYLRKYKEADDEKIQRALKGEVMVRINILRQISARGKIKEVAEFVQDFQEEGQKIVLFCSLHEVVDQLKKIFPHAVSVTGRENTEQKQQAIDMFQKNPKTNIIICSIRAAGVGLTLTAASNVAFVEFPWTYADCCQCEDRCIVEGEPILTPDGWKPVETIKKGDIVINRFGNKAVVTDSWSKQNTKLVTEIHVEGWGIIKTTNDHRILTSNGWKEASMLLPGDRIVMPKQEIEVPELISVPFDNDCRLPDLFIGSLGQVIPNGRLIKAPDEIIISDDSLFTFGYFAGDGHASIKKGKGRYISVAGNINGKRESLDRCKNWFDSIGLYHSERSKSDETIGTEVRAYSGEWAMFFRKHFGKSASGKMLPEFLMYLNQRQSKVLLSGLMASDGYYRKGRYEYITASKKLASQVARLILRSGYRPTVGNNSTGQLLIAYAESQDNNLALVRSVCTHFPKKENGTRPRVYDLTTDDTESFVVGLSVVHNCHRIGQKDSVTAYYFLGKNTIDEKVYKIIQLKKGIANAVTGSLDDVPENIVDMVANLFNEETED